MKVKLLIIISIISNIAFGQFKDKNELKTVTKEIIAIIKKSSIIKDSANWTELNNQLIMDIDSLQTIDSSNCIISKIINILEKHGDNHSYFMHKTFVDEMLKPYNKSIPLPNSKLLENNIGYLFLPSHPNFNKEVNYLYADTLKKQIQYLDENNHITGWIVDLRKNRGGNMHPMIAGLNPIIENNTVGYFVSDKYSKRLKSNSKRIYYCKRMNNNYKCRNLNNKIAILIDTITASAGEMIAISLSGMENSRSFGHRSKGTTTMISRYALSYSSNLFLATSFFADKNKKVYRKHINPDIVVDNDIIIHEAIEWITK